MRDKGFKFVHKSFNPKIISIYYYKCKNLSLKSFPLNIITSPQFIISVLKKYTTSTLVYALWAGFLHIISSTIYCQPPFPSSPIIIIHRTV